MMAEAGAGSGTESGAAFWIEKEIGMRCENGLTIVVREVDYLVVDPPFEANVVSHTGQRDEARVGYRDRSRHRADP